MATSHWEAWSEYVRGAGLGPDDVDERPVDPPSEVVVNVIVPVDCGGEIVDAREFRAFPLFMEKAALRWADYCRRRYGAKNVWVDYE